MDYNVTNGVFNVTIPAGELSSSFSIDIIDDTIQEDNETFNIAIRLLPSCLSLSLGTASSTVTIVDNDEEGSCLLKLCIRVHISTPFMNYIYVAATKHLCP